MRCNLSRSYLVENLEWYVCTIRYDDPGSGMREIRGTLRRDYINQLDNHPQGFDTYREAALFDLHSINVLDIDNNRWENIQCNRIQKFIVLDEGY